MSALSPTTEPCTVCDKPGLLLCGRCKAVRLCSDRCHRILWPVHKALCGRDTKTFFLPHLSPAGQELLQSIKDEEFESTGMSYKEYVTSSPLGMSWQSYLDFISTPNSSQLQKAAFRNDLLVFAYYHLGTVQRERHPTEPLPVWYAFGTVAHLTFLDVVPDYTDFGRPPLLWRDCARILRQQLVYVALLSSAVGPAAALSLTERKDLQKLAIRREIEAVEQSELSRRAKAFLTLAAITRPC